MMEITYTYKVYIPITFYFWALETPRLRYLDKSWTVFALKTPKTV